MFVCFIYSGHLYSAITVIIRRRMDMGAEALVVDVAMGAAEEEVAAVTEAVVMGVDREAVE